MMLMYGSTVFVILLSDRALTDPALWHAPWLFPGMRAAMAGTHTHLSARVRAGRTEHLSRTQLYLGSHVVEALQRNCRAYTL
jgi:xylulokinase